MANEFQTLLGELVEKVKPNIYVETGFMTGESAKEVAKAMDKNGFGEIYSIEPFINPGFTHPRLTLSHGYSYEKMTEVFLKTGEWDIFLHDSNHDVGCMAFELELAWSFVKRGGIIACDDYTWGTPEHNAWKNFLARHEVSANQLGSAQYCYKPLTASDPVKDEDWAKAEWTKATLISNAACIEYGVKQQFPTVKKQMKTYCLTLHETPERTEFCKKHFKERGIEAEFIYGFHAGTCGLRTENNYEVDSPGSGFNIGKHGVGIWTSMIMCYQVMLSQPDEHIFLLEHDANFDENWKGRFDQAMKDVPKDFDFLFAGHCCVKSDHSKKHVKGDVWKVNSPFCNHACVIAKKALPFVIETLKKKCWAPVDIQLASEVFPHLKVYAIISKENSNGIAKQWDTVIQP